MTLQFDGHKMTRQFTRKKFWFPHGRIEWAITGPAGSVSFWATPLNSDFIAKFGETHYGGVEYHHATPRDEGAEFYNHNECCPINAGPCWHDGTSLWASEHWIPKIMPLGDDAIFEELEKTYRKNMEHPDAQ